MFHKPFDINVCSPDLKIPLFFYAAKNTHACFISTASLLSVESLTVTEEQRYRHCHRHPQWVLSLLWQLWL